jgi:hypothetical protein
MDKDKDLDDITKLAEQAKVVAAATGRDEADVLADLLDDGIANNSHRGEEKDLITQLREAAELITTVQSINAEVSENTVLNGGENKTEVLVETTLDGDIVDRAIASVHRKAENIKKIAIILIPVFLLLTGGSMEAFGMTNWFGSDDESDNGDEYYVDYGGCTNMDANNYDSQASWDDGSCYWDDGGNHGGGGGPPCDSAWTYDDYSYSQDSNIYIEFNFFDNQDCDVPMTGHFMIYLYQNGNYHDEDSIGNVDFVNFITDFVSFTDLEEGNYDYTIEFHTIECDDGTCEHGSEYESPHRPNFYIEEDCVASPSYDNLILMANADDLTIEADFQDTNNCGVDIKIMISTYLNDGYQDTVDYDEIQEYWISELGVTSIKIEDYIGLKDLEDGDWKIEFRFRTINTNSNDYEECCQMSNEVVIDEIEDIVYGCTNSSADNYNELATEDDGTCEYPPDVDCEVEIINHYRGHIAEDAEQDAILVAFRVVPNEGCEEGVEIDLFLKQPGQPVNYSTSWELEDSSQAEDFTHTFDGVAVGDSWTPVVTAYDMNNDSVIESIMMWSIDIEEQEPEVCEINLFWIGFATNASHAQVGYDLDCGEGANDLEGYNVSVQLLVYEIGSANNSSTQPILYETRLHYIQGWVEDNHFITLTNFTDSNNTHYDFYCYFTWIDGVGESQMMEYKWLNRELEA